MSGGAAAAAAAARKPGTGDRQHLLASLGAAALCLAATFALFGGALRLGWCCDDTQILLHALRYPPWAYFGDAAAWRALIPFSLTPWLTLAYDADHALFGFAPAAYHLHALLALALTALLVYLLAGHWMARRHAAVAALLFLAGVPVAQASHGLMVRHYVEGLAAWLLAMLIVQRRLERPGWANGTAAALAFAVAASAKEVYLPLGLLPLVVAPAAWARRLRATAPLLVVMALYVPWRGYMLGTLLGGYVPGGELSAGGTLSRLAQFAQVPGLLFAQPLLALAACAFVAAAAIAGVRERRAATWARGAATWARGAAQALAVIVLVAAPLLPLTVFPGIGKGSERYFFAPWAVFALCYAAALSRASRHAAPGLRAGLWLATAGVVAATWPPARLALAESAAVHAEHQAHFELLTRGGADDVLLAAPSVPEWFIDGALALRGALGAVGAPPLVVADEADADAAALAGKRVWRYDAGTRALADGRAGLDAALAAWRERLREMPMAVSMQYDVSRRIVRWRFDPAEGARFTVLSPRGRLDAPFAAGALHYEKPPRCFRIRRDGSDGGIAYSPWLELKSSPGGLAVSWQGTSLAAVALHDGASCATR